MDTVWAPWRMDFIEGNTPKEECCVFCNRAAAPREQWRDRGILDCGGHTLVLMNRYPYTNGHLLVIPHRHVCDLMELTPGEYAHLCTVLRLCVDRMKTALNPQGFNIGMNVGAAAGAGIADHAHFHIVPRWGGDHNFMPVIGNVRVMPEYLLATYDRLLSHFHDICMEG